MDSEGFLRVEGRLSNSPELTEKMKHSLIFPCRSAQTRLVVLQYHVNSCHVEVKHTLFCTRRKFWIVIGHASVKRYISKRGRCSLKKARSVGQLMADMPVVRTSACHKAFAISDGDYLGCIDNVEGRSTRKAWGLLFIFRASRDEQVEIFTSLVLKDFLMAFSRLADVGGKVEIIY